MAGNIVTKRKENQRQFPKMIDKISPAMMTLRVGDLLELENELVDEDLNNHCWLEFKAHDFM